MPFLCRCRPDKALPSCFPYHHHYNEEHHWTGDLNAWHVIVPCFNMCIPQKSLWYSCSQNQAWCLWNGKCETSSLVGTCPVKNVTKIRKPMSPQSKDITIPFSMVNYADEKTCSLEEARSVTVSLFLNGCHPTSNIFPGPANIVLIS